MGRLSFYKIEIPGVVVIEPVVFGDNRGFFIESYNYRDFADYGIDVKFIQDNHSKSKKGILRGLHFQYPHTQSKLVRVVSGSVYDVAVDLRAGSPTYGKYFGLLISAENKKMMYIPEGFAHGFLALEDNTEFLYKVTDYWYGKYETGIRWNDPDIAISWPGKEYNIPQVVVSKKDAALQTLKEYNSPFRY